MWSTTKRGFVHQRGLLVCLEYIWVNELPVALTHCDLSCRLRTDRSCVELSRLRGERGYADSMAREVWQPVVYRLTLARRNSVGTASWHTVRAGCASGRVPLWVWHWTGR